MPTKILIVDDESAARAALAELLKDEGFETRSAADGFKALGKLDDFVPDVVLTDLKMPGMSGLELMRKVRELAPSTSVVVMTAFGSIETAVEAMQDGASDFVTKPIALPHLLAVLKRVVEHRHWKTEAERLRSILDGQRKRDDRLLGNSKTLQQVVSVANQIAASPVSVLINGESGTGKEAMARAIHAGSATAERPFEVVACAEESEAALTNRVQNLAECTVYLKDIDTLPRPAQALVHELITDPDRGVRVIASSTRDLAKLADGGEFSSDLLYPLSVVVLKMPSLLQRQEDIPVLAAHLLRKHSRYYQKGIDGFHERVLQTLTNFDWPGNIDQLDATLEHAVVMCRGTTIEPRHLPAQMRQSGGRRDDAPKVPGASLHEIERHAILATLEHVGGSTSRAARILGISPRKIQYRLAEYRDSDGADQSAAS